jgi:hypothetical protein
MKKPFAQARCKSLLDRRIAPSYRRSVELAIHSKPSDRHSPGRGAWSGFLQREWGLEQAANLRHGKRRGIDRAAANRRCDPGASAILREHRLSVRRDGLREQRAAARPRPRAPSTGARPLPASQLPYGRRPLACCRARTQPARVGGTATRSPTAALGLAIVATCPSDVRRTLKLAGPWETLPSRNVT